MIEGVGFVSISFGIFSFFFIFCCSFKSFFNLFISIFHFFKLLCFSFFIFRVFSNQFF